MATPHMAQMAQMKPEYISGTQIVSWETED